MPVRAGFVSLYHIINAHDLPDVSKVYAIWTNFIEDGLPDSVLVVKIGGAIYRSVMKPRSWQFLLSSRSLPTESDGGIDELGLIGWVLEGVRDIGVLGGATT
jgi:hypothetical protein